MKKITILLISALFALISIDASAQFSWKNIKPAAEADAAFTLPMGYVFSGSAGVKISDRLVFGVGGAYFNEHFDSVSSDVHLASGYFWNRYYFLRSNGKRSAFYTDLKIGASIVTNNPRQDPDDPSRIDDKGDLRPYLRLALGYRIAIHKDFGLNIGPNIGTDGFGIHLGFSL